MIWEVDEDCDTCVSWVEFQLMFERCSSDKARHCHRSRTRHPTSATAPRAMLTDARRARRGWSQGGCSTWSSS